MSEGKIDSSIEQIEEARLLMIGDKLFKGFLSRYFFRGMVLVREKKSFKKVIAM